MFLLSSPNRLPLLSLFCFVFMFSIDVFPEMFVPSFLSLFFPSIGLLSLW